MTKENSGIEPDMGARVRLIRHSTGMNVAPFLQWLEKTHGLQISFNSWCSYEQGYPMHWRSARTLARAFSFVTMDYIYRPEIHAEARKMVGVNELPTSTPAAPHKERQ
jgi:hypothetical protein